MGKEYIERSNVGPCRLERSDLIELANVAREGLPEEHGFEVLAEFENTQGDWSSVEEFLKHKKLPNEPRELTLRAWYPKTYRNIRQIEKSIDIRFGSLGSYATVAGNDETWVIGKHNQVIRFFERKSNRVHLVTERAEKVIKSDLLLSVVIGLWIVGVFSMIANVGLAYAILFSVSSTYLLLKYLGWAKSWKFTRVKISLKSRTGFVLLGMETKDAIPIAISILALIISLVQIFVP